MMSFKIIASLILTLSLFSCFPKSKDRPDETNGGNANFAVSAVSGSIGGSKNVGDFPLPGEKTYNFKACLIDFSRRTNIPNAKFLIKEIDQTYSTDAQGCLNWPETIKFNYLADSVWLKMTRTLVAKGLQRGSRPIDFAINPWSHGESLPDVMDLAKQSTPYLLEKDEEISQRLQGKDTGDQLKTRKIWVESGDLNVTNGKLIGQTYTWHDQIFLKPQILFAKTDSTPVLVPIVHGSFKVEISLISEDVKNQKTQRIVLAQQIVQKADITNNTLMIDVDFALKSGPTSGQAILGVKLIPIGVPEGLRPFEGIFPLGNWNAFTQSAPLKISENVSNQNAKGQFSIQSFVGGESGGKAAIGANGQNIDHMEGAGVFAEHLHIDDFKIVSESGTKKTLSYRVRTCLASTVGNVGLTRREFQVQMIGPNGEAIASSKVLSDHESCLYWEGRTQEFDRNECHHYIPIAIKIKNADLGMDQSEKILINPWMEKGADSREAQDAGQYPLACDASNPHIVADNMIFLKTVMLQRVSYRPQVLDKSLQLTQHAVYTFTMSDSGIIDYSNESSGLVTTPKPFPAGKYLMRWVLVRDAEPRPDNGYVTHADVIVDADGGTLHGDLDLTIVDLQSTMVRKMLIAQLFPIDMEKYKSKNWKNNDPDIESIIDRKTKLVSPTYYANTITLGMTGTPIYLKRGIDEIPALGRILTQGFKTDIGSGTLIHDIVAKGEAAQEAMVKKNLFDENDKQAWATWSKDQNLDSYWLNDAGAAQAAKQDLELEGEPTLALQELLNGKKIDAKWGKQFCKVLTHKTWKSVINIPTALKYTACLGTSDCFEELCQNIIAKNPSAFIKRSTVYRILHTAGPGIANNAKLAVSSLSVSSGFGFTAGHTEIDGTQSSLGFQIQGGVSTPTKILSAGLGASYGAGAVHMTTDDKNRHSTTDLGTSVSLGVTRWQFDIPVDSYQKCIMLRTNPSIFLFDKDHSSSSIFSFFKDKYVFYLNQFIDKSNLYKLQNSENPLTHGWMICSDKISNDLIHLPETYYMVSQNNGDTETFDSIDDKNRQFFLPIRGVSDMGRFKAIIGGSRDYPETGELTDEARSDLAAQLSPLIRRIDSGPSMILFDPNYEPPADSKKESESK